jgi:histidinol-phosphate aminotransferase
LGNGSTELVELLALVFGTGRAPTILAGQTFIMYRIAVAARAGRFREVPLREERYDLHGMAAECGEGPTLVFIANPNNPTGTYVTRAELQDYFLSFPLRC